MTMHDARKGRTVETQDGERGTVETVLAGDLVRVRFNEKQTGVFLAHDLTVVETV